MLEKILTPLSTLDGLEEVDNFWGPFTYPENSRVIFSDGTHEVTEEKKKLKPHERGPKESADGGEQQKVLQAKLFTSCIFFSYSLII